MAVLFSHPTKQDAVSPNSNNRNVQKDFGLYYICVYIYIYIYIYENMAIKEISMKKLKTAHIKKKLVKVQELKICVICAFWFILIL